MRQPKGNVEEAVGCMSQDYGGEINTEDLNVALPLYSVVSDLNTS